MSSIALKYEGREWTLNARWIAFRKRPSQSVLCSHAGQIGATHYVLNRGTPWLAGFFTFDDKVKVKGLLPAALAVAKHLGPNAYGEIEPVPGKLWIVATDAHGSLLPFSDTVLSADNRNAFEARIDPRLLEKRICVTLSEIDDLLAKLEPQSLPATEIGSPRLMIGLGVIVVVAGSIGTALHLWHQHEEQVMADAALDLKRTLAREARIRAANVTIVTPDDWIEACMNKAENAPLYASGWIAREWSCDSEAFSVTWTRSGGTLAQAPDGQFDSKGDTILSRVALDPRREHPKAPPPGNAVRMFLAKLQAAGVDADLQVQTLQPKGDAPNAEASSEAVTEFVWPGDPRHADWNAIPRLQLVSMHGTTGLAVGNGGNSTPGTYRITAKILLGAGQ